MATLTFAEVFNALKDAIVNRNDNVSPQGGSIVTDTVITPVSLEIVKQSIREDFVSRIPSVDKVLKLLEDDDLLQLLAIASNKTVDDTEAEIRSALENYAANFNIVRKTPTFATGFVQFGRDTVPASDLTITSGTVVGTAAGQQYTTTDTVAMTVVGIDDFFDGELGLYIVSAPVQAISDGSNGNATANTINQFVTSIAGFNFLTNTDALTNGTDEESDEDFVDRIKLAFSAGNIGTRDGYKRLVLEDTDITDVAVIGAGDDLMLRDNNSGGDVDIRILDRNIVQINEVFTSVTNPQVLTKQPVSEVVSTSSGTGSLVKDASVLTEGSIRAVDEVLFSILPVASYSVTYTYDKNVETVQAVLDLDENKILGSDELIRQAALVDADIEFEYTVETGFSKQLVTPEIIAALNAFISSLKLGDDLEQSDAIVAIQGVDGVDRIILPMTTFNRTGVGGVTDVIEANSIEFIRLKNLTII